MLFFRAFFAIVALFAAFGHAAVAALAVPLHLRQDLPDVVPKADVQHPVHLVEHGEAHVLEVDDAAVQQVHHPAGRADEHLRAVLQVLHLLADPLPADDAGRTDGGVPGEAGDLVCHLRAQLARRHEDDGLKRQPGDGLLHDRDAERRRLARPGAGLAQHVSPGEHRRNQQPLNVAWGLEPYLGQRLENARAYPEVGKGLWQGRVVGLVAHEGGSLRAECVRMPARGHDVSASRRRAGRTAVRCPECYPAGVIDAKSSESCAALRAPCPQRHPPDVRSDHPTLRHPPD